MTSPSLQLSRYHSLLSICFILLLDSISTGMAFVVVHERFHQRLILPSSSSSSSFSSSTGTPFSVRLLQQTRLQSSLLLTPTTAVAATALTSSALTGMWMERRKPNSGILTSLAVSSLVFSRVAPTTHVLYDMCWNTFLPASLALLLLGMPQTTKEKRKEQEETADTPQNKETIRTVVSRLALPFGLASIGSLLGCTASFFLCRSFRSILWLSTADAAWAGACLSASFVGGSVNFLATAAWIASQQAVNQGTTTLVSAMTAADLIVMAVYFALMAAATQSVSLQRWFHRTHHVRGAVESATPVTHVATTEIVPTSSSSSSSSSSQLSTPSSPFPIPISLFVTAIAFGLVRVGQVFERVCASYIPGMACAWLAVVTPWVSQYMPPQASIVAPPLSQFCFFLLFAAVGVTADLGAALQSGPACLVFAAVALLIHGLVLLVGGRYTLAPGRPKAFLDCLIASNAAIGGPATAATFCGTLKNNTQALTIAATIWGVFGYAIGTTVGVGMYRFLSAFM